MMHWEPRRWEPAAAPWGAGAGAARAADAAPFTPSGGGRGRRDLAAAVRYAVLALGVAALVLALVTPAGAPDAGAPAAAARTVGADPAAPQPVGADPAAPQPAGADPAAPQPAEGAGGSGDVAPPTDGAALVPALLVLEGTAAAAIPPEAPPAPSRGPADGAAVGAAAAQAAGPVQAVTGFYAAVAGRRLDLALRYWSPRMRAAYPPPVYLYDRFAGTRQLTVRRADVVSLDGAAGRATVAVTLAEVSARPAFTRTWQGTWSVVRTPAGWQLDQPSFRG